MNEKQKIQGTNKNCFFMCSKFDGLKNALFMHPYMAPQYGQFLTSMKFVK